MLYNANYREKGKRKNIHYLKIILKELQKRNLITTNESNILQYLNENMKHIIKCKIQKKNLPMHREYEPSLRQFVLSLHYYLPRAYNFVRFKFYNTLPHPKTISKWYRSIDGEPGINNETLEAMKLRARSCACRLIGTLIFDEQYVSMWTIMQIDLLAT